MGWALLLLIGSAGAAEIDVTGNNARLQAAAAAPRLQLAPLDLKTLASEDVINDKLSGQPLRYAVPHEVRIRSNQGGHWRWAKGGQAVWQQWIAARGAAHLNFGFSEFELPASAELRIIAADGSDQLGPYTALDRLPHGQLWTPVLLDDEALIELRVDAAELDQVNLALHRVGQGYRGFGARAPACKSGSCNTDVACLAANDAWNEPRRAAAGYSTGGSNICSGALINNTRNDYRMLFATAAHCGIANDAAAASVVVYWNYESPTCRTPGSTESGNVIARPTGTTQGLRLLASTDSIAGGGGSTATRSDWTLIELATPPTNNTFNLFWAGWDRSPPPTTCSAPASASATNGLCASIHHPNGDEKRITFVESSMTLANYGGTATNLHWFAEWDPTPPLLPNISPALPSLPPSVTEPGSSGSPLFNAERRLIGVLSGGASFCGASPAALNDLYGGLFHAWDGLGSTSTRMRDHLDPLGLNPTSLNGIDRSVVFSNGFESTPAAR